MVKLKVVLEQKDLKTQNPCELNDVTHELGEQIMPLESIEVNPLSYCPLQNNEGQNERQNERRNIKQNNTETMPDILRSMCKDNIHVLHVKNHLIDKLYLMKYKHNNYFLKE